MFCTGIYVFLERSMRTHSKQCLIRKVVCPDKRYMRVLVHKGGVGLQAKLRLKVGNPKSYLYWLSNGNSRWSMRSKFHSPPESGSSCTLMPFADASSPFPPFNTAESTRGLFVVVDAGPQEPN